MLIVLLLICIIPLFLFSIRLLHAHKTSEQRGQHNAVVELCRDLGTRIQRAAYLNASSQPELSGAIDMAAQIFEGRIFVINADLLIVKDTYGGREEGKTIISEEAVSALYGKENVYRKQ